MTQSTDLLDRVAAANPIPPDAPLSPEDRRRADALLGHVLSTPPNHIRARRPARRTRAFILAGVAAATIIAAVLTSVMDRGPSIAERAYAAVSKPSLYHVVSHTTVDAPPVFTRGDFALPSNDMVIESWYDLERPAYHVVHYELRGGRRTMVLESAGNPDGTTSRDSADQDRRPVEQLPGGGPPDVERFDPTAQFKKAYREGNVREDGTATVDGRRTQRLVIAHDAEPVADPGFIVRSSRTVAFFDAETMYPLEFVTRSDIETNGRRGTVVNRTRYTTFETLPRTPENLAKLRMANSR